MACHHRLLTAYTVRRRRTWHIIIALGLHTQLDKVGSGNSIVDLGHYTRSENIGLDMPQSHLGKHTMDDIDVEFHHPLWTTQIVRRCRARHARMALGQQRQSDDIRHGMSLSPLGNRCDQTTSSVACHHLFCAAHTVGQYRAGHPIIILESIHDKTRSA